MHTREPVPEEAVLSAARQADVERDEEVDLRGFVSPAVKQLRATLKDTRRLMGRLYRLRQLSPLTGDDYLPRFLSGEEVAAHWQRLLEALVPLLKDMVAAALPVEQRGTIEQLLEALGQNADVCAVLDQAIRRVEEHVRKARGAKPRKTERDAEIVRLRDEEKLAYKDIPKRLKEKNSDWVRPGGKLLSTEAIRVAYGRARENKV